MTPPSAQKLGWRRGLWAAAPLVPGLFSVGVLYGVAAAGSGLPPWTVVLTSLLVATGTAQWIALDLLGQGIAWWLIILAGLLVNVRFAIYAMQLGPFARGFGPLGRLPYLALVTDEGYALTTPLALPRRPGTPEQLHWSGALMAACWLAWPLGTLVGTTAGPVLPTDLRLEVAIPLTLLTILVLLVRTRRHLLVAMAAGGVSLLLQQAPSGLGLVAGLAAGALVGWWLGRTAPTVAVAS